MNCLQLIYILLFKLVCEFHCLKRAATVGFTWKKDNSHCYGADTNQMENDCFFVASVGWTLARFENEWFEPFFFSNICFIYLLLQ